jgi:hypothetical protein
VQIGRADRKSKEQSMRKFIIITEILDTKQITIMKVRVTRSLLETIAKHAMMSGAVTTQSR